MPRNNYRSKAVRRRHTLAEPEKSDYQVTMTNGKTVKRVTVSGTSGVNAWNLAIRSGRRDESDVWWPIEVARPDTGWSYPAR